MPLGLVMLILVAAAVASLWAWERWGVNAYPLYLAVAVIALISVKTTEFKLIESVRITLFGY